jgi:hypothetical protein
MPATGTQLASVQAMSATSCPSVYHPTISEYYPLVLRLGDYLRCILCPADFLNRRRLRLGKRNEHPGKETLEVALHCIISTGFPNVALHKDAWPTGGLARVGLQLQTQVDVSV